MLIRVPKLCYCRFPLHRINPATTEAKATAAAMLSNTARMKGWLQSPCSCQGNVMDCSKSKGEVEANGTEGDRRPNGLDLLF